MWPKSERRTNILKILKEEREARQARADASANINDNADSICWFCHADVSNLENNKCAGCRKVKTQLRIHCRWLIDIIFSRFRGGTVTRGARKQTGGDMVTIVSKCKRRSGRRWRQKRLKRERRLLEHLNKVKWNYFQSLPVEWYFAHSAFEYYIV